MRHKDDASPFTRDLHTNRAYETCGVAHEHHVMSTEKDEEVYRFRYNSDKNEADYEYSELMTYPRVTYRHLLSTTYEPENPLRVIAHCDVDAAYAQFEASRLGIDSNSVPLAVLQWKRIIAVNYVARMFGVNRFNCTLEEAKQRCPDLRLVHVASYGPGDKTPKYYEDPHPSTHKISLDMYRRESKKIMDIFQRQLCHDRVPHGHANYELESIKAEGWVPSVLHMEGQSKDHDIIFEKASIDESFFDLSKYVRKQMLSRFPWLDIREELNSLDTETRAAQLDAELPPIPTHIRDELQMRAWCALGAWLPSSELKEKQTPLSPLTWIDVAHAMAAERMISMRWHILNKLGYTTSAGIASNKSLAKLCSSFRKPCSQTMLLPRYMYAFLAPTPYRKIRFLGGKFGADIEEEWNQTTVRELWGVSLASMEERFGADGEWLYYLIRGVDTSDVVQRSANHSMMSAKNFRPGISTTPVALSWLAIMSSELSARLQEEREEIKMMYPRTLVLRYLLADASTMKSHQVPFGQIANEHLDHEIYVRAEKLWNETLGRAMQQPGRVDVRVLSLSFAGIERKMKDQQPLSHFFFKRKSEHDAEVPHKFPRTQSPSYDLVTDPASQTEMAQWTCLKCSRVLSVPIFDDVELHATEPPSYLRILQQAREEHEHWHMAMALAESLE